MAAMTIHWLRYDAHVSDAGLLDGIHYGGEGAEGNVLIGAQINCLVLRIANLLLNGWGDLIDVDGIVAQKNFLRFVDADYETFFRNFLHGAGVRDVYFNAGLQDWSGDHKNDEQHEDDVHERSDVDIGERGRSAAIGGGKGHQRPASGAAKACWRSADCRSKRFSISMAKSSLREASSRMEPMIRLEAITAGVAAA